MHCLDQMVSFWRLQQQIIFSPEDELRERVFASSRILIEWPTAHLSASLKGSHQKLCIIVCLLQFSPFSENAILVTHFSKPIMFLMLLRIHKEKYRIGLIVFSELICYILVITLHWRLNALFRFLSLSIFDNLFTCSFLKLSISDTCVYTAMHKW